MRFFTAVALAGAASATVITRQTVPQCALTCILSADLGGCSTTDYKCLCSNQAFVDSTKKCLKSTCAGSDLQNAIAFAEKTCESVGVTLTDTDIAPATSTALSGSRTGPIAAFITAGGI